MKIECIAIGNELLAGFAINSNAAFISKELLMHGWAVCRHTTLPDDGPTLKKGLQEALERSDVVITTGGLGPTGDDITRAVVAELFACGMRYDQRVAADLRRRRGDDLATLHNQATIPEKALAFLNDVGTAPALLLSKQNKIIILLPGVPQEMKPLFTCQIIPYLINHCNNDAKQWRRRLYMWGVAEEKVDPLLQAISSQDKTISYGLYPSQGILSVHLIAYGNEEETLARLDIHCQTIEKAFSCHLFHAEDGKIEEAVQRCLTERCENMSIAESCTGGALAARLTALAGASHFFLGSIVAYNDELKEKLLGVNPELLRNYGAVSKEVVIAMAQGVQTLTGSDWSLAVSGIAGPGGGSSDKPVGTIWGAVMRRGAPPHAWLIPARGSRTTIIEQSSNALLGQLYLQLCQRT